MAYFERNLMEKKEFESRYRTERHRDFWKRFLSRMPEELMPYLYVRNSGCGEVLISSAKKSGTVYFLMRGRLFAMEERVQSLPYVFTELMPVDIVGDYELFSDMEDSYATIMAARDCELIAMPADLYLGWISQDAGALFYRVGLLMNQLGGQAAASRQYFFLDYTGRLVSLLLQYAIPDAKGIALLRMTRESLAARIGCSLRTCHRVVNGLKERGMVSLVHGKIVVDEGQRELLQQYLAEEMERL